MKIFLILSLAIAAVSAAPGGSERIVGGSVTNIYTYPEMASILFSLTGDNHRHTCGGMVINNRSVLTAAQCTHGNLVINLWRIRLGSTYANSGGTIFVVSRITNHASFNAVTFDNDIAVLRSSTNFVFSHTIRPGSIAGTAYNLDDNQLVVAVGWGATESGFPSEELRHVSLRSVNQAICTQRYGTGITANMLCAGLLDVGGSDTCEGDTGGPLLHNYVAVGVVSWGIGCGRPQFPSVFTRISRYTAWITTNA